MPLPPCLVPTHADWKILRAKNGGKEGLSKVSMGKKLDDFHNWLKTGDDKTSSAAIGALEMAADKYSTDVKKKYPKLAAAVDTEIVQELRTFRSAIHKADARNAQTLATIKQELMTTITNQKKLLDVLKQADSELSLLVKKFADGVPLQAQPTLSKAVTDYTAKLNKAQGQKVDIQQFLHGRGREDDAVSDQFKGALELSESQMAQIMTLESQARSSLSKFTDLVEKSPA